MSSKVLITREIPEKGIRILRKSGLDCIVNKTGRPMTRNDLETNIKEVDAVISMLYDRIDQPLLAMASNLRIVANYAVGIDNIDVNACTASGVTVTNTPGVLTEATADLTLALILSAARKIVSADRYFREGLFNGWDPLLFVGDSLTDKTFGIIGMGRIGQAVAKRVRGFDMRIIYHNRKPLPDNITAPLEAKYYPLDEVIREADFLSLHLPYSPEVHHLINKERLNMMKPGAYLINTARGAHVDEKSLVDHLRSKKIAGAALDVYESEPLPAEGLVSLDNVTLLPHLGSATVYARNAMAEMAAGSVVAVLSGHKALNIINPQVFDG
jgi:glyoxylate reductase